MMSDTLYKQLSTRVNELSKLPKVDEQKSIPELMEENGFSRRDFMTWAGGITAMLALPASYTPLIARAAEVADRLPVVWLHMAECTGCTEALLRSASPSIDSLIFNHISLEYQETIMSAAGWQAEQNLEHAIEKYKGTDK